MFDSEFSDVYERAAAITLRDVIAVSPKTFNKSGFDNDIIHCYEEEFTSPFCHLSVTSGRDWVELISRERWVAASRGQPVFDTWVRSQWEPGGALCVIGVPLKDMLVRCGNSAPSMDINLFDHLSGLMDGTDLLCDTDESVVSSVQDSRWYLTSTVYNRSCLIRGYWRLQVFTLMCVT